MVSKTFQINLTGYWQEENKSDIPHQSGIYCVYSGIYNRDLNQSSPSKLIYVGAAKNVNKEISTHKELWEWKRYVEEGEQLCYTFGAVDPADLQRCADAIIFINKPPANSGTSDKFQFEDTTITLSGEIPFLRASFLVS